MAAFLLGPWVSAVKGQDQGDYMSTDGIPSYTSTLPVESGFIKMANGTLHLEIPLGSFPQRGGQTFKSQLEYDSDIFTYAYALVTVLEPDFDTPSLGGWRLVTSADSGWVENNDISKPCGSGHYYDWVQQWIWHAPDGSDHAFPITTKEPYTCGPSVPSGDAFAMDSSGYHMFVTDYQTVTVVAPDGTQFYPGLSSAGIISVKDANGNYYVNSMSVGYNLGGTYQDNFAGGSVTDNLGRVLLTSSASGSTIYLDVLSSKGTTSRYTIATSTINVSPYDVGSIVVIQSVQLPDSTTYSFTYDCDASTGNPACALSRAEKNQTSGAEQN